jgi:hypothetical protein
MSELDQRWPVWVEEEEKGKEGKKKKRKKGVGRPVAILGLVS